MATEQHSPAAATEGQPHGPEPGVTAHGHPSEAEYVRVAMILAAITGMEVAVYYITAVKDALVPLLLTFAVVKFSMVALWFMHLRFDSRIFRRLFLTGIILALSVYIVVLSTLHVFVR